MDITYDGSTRCSAIHESNAVIETCAPADIGGDGDHFSPTDLVGAALGSCILTTIAMWAQRQGIDLTTAKAHVTKEMSTETPRRIAKFATTITIPAGILSEDMRERAEQIAHACPVHKSLHPEIQLPIEFIYE